MSNKWNSDEGRFWAKVDRRGEYECWLWQAATLANGYGTIAWGGRQQGAHRVAYMIVRGEIPEGMHLDHLCRVRNCVNPAHLEPVPHRVNNNRGIGPTAQNARKTHCKRGHLLEGANIRIRAGAHGPERECLPCMRLLVQKWRMKQKGITLDVDAIAPTMDRSDGVVKTVKKSQTHCKRGHPNSEYRRRDKNGSHCIACAAILARERNKARRGDNFTGARKHKYGD